MAGRGQQTFKKRQKEQQRRERQQEKMAKRLQRKQEGGTSPLEEEIPLLEGPPEITDDDFHPILESER